MAKISIAPGTKIGKLTVISEGEKFIQPSGQSQRGIICECECGNTKTIRLSHLVRGRIASCNCRSHGMVGTKLYNTWRGMIGRCLSTHSESHLYHDKAISVVDEWKKFKVFMEWANENGYEEGLQIDRIDNAGGYYPSNCRFVTPAENCNNRNVTMRVHYKGSEVAFMNLIREKGLGKHAAAIRGRLSRGWSPEEAFDNPIRKLIYKSSTKECIQNGTDLA